jgi:hypothetical protein
MSPEPGRHPEPPVDFPSRVLPIISLGGSFFRSHGRSRSPLNFGRTGRNRFDDPLGDYSVLYAGRDIFAAFIETFGQDTGIRTLTTEELRSRSLTEFYPADPLVLVDLCSSGCLTRVGADSGLFAGERTVAQRWSRAIYEHPSARLAGIHGILYPARHNHTRQAVAIFNRNNLPRLEIIRTHSWYGEDGEGRSNLSAILNLYGFSLVETVSRPERKKPGTSNILQGDLFEE